MSLFTGPTIYIIGLGIGLLCSAVYFATGIWYRRLINPNMAQTKAYNLILSITAWGFLAYVLAIIILWLLVAL